MPKALKKVLLLIDTSMKFGREFLLGIAKYTHFHKSWFFYRNPPSYKKDTGIRLSRLKEWGLDGIIVYDISVDSKRFEEIINTGLPTVVKSMKKEIPGLANIITDDSAIGAMAAEHLLDCGLKNFAYCGLDDMYWSNERGKSFRERIANAGFETHFYQRPTSKVKRLWENEQVIMSSWLKSLPKPLGLMVCSDEWGQNVLEVCKIAEIPVPDQIAVIGVDNDEMVCELCDVPLTSIQRNARGVGYQTAELLDRLMAGEKMKDEPIILRPTHVVVRQSTNTLAITDNEVVRAIRFIRQHTGELIQVSEVVNETGVSRRVLERRFRRELNRSILDEIRRVRINQISRMLIETDLTVSQIASALGHPSADHIARYFRQGKRMTPVAYRKEYGFK